jgi:predicted PurR-regulated permease PerM
VVLSGSVVNDAYFSSTENHGFAMWYKNKFFKITTGIILLLLILYLAIQLKPILNLFYDFITTLLYPIMIAIVLYYVLRPLLQFMEKKRIPRILSIIIIFFIIYLFISFIIMFIWPYVSQQVSEFTATPKEKIKELENRTVDFMNLFNIAAVSKEQLRETLIYYFHQLVSYVTTNLIVTLGSIAKIASYFIITPFLLFYFLKDDKDMGEGIVKMAPKKYKHTASSILDDVDEILSIYISGQVLIAFIVALLIFIGYWIIGLHYAFLLAIITFVFNLIPFCGPFIATIPALLIGLGDSPFMAVKVLAVVLMVHLLDLNLISPRIVGQRLNIHPVTVIILLVASLSVFGLVSLFIITPLYAVIKVLIRDFTKQNGEEEV